MLTNVISITLGKQVYIYSNKLVVLLSLGLMYTELTFLNQSFVFTGARRLFTIFNFRFSLLILLLISVIHDSFRLLGESIWAGFDLSRGSLRLY